MILVDTSIWIDHLRNGDEQLVTLLNESKVLLHPFVIGELACGNLRNRTEVLRLLKDLPQAVIATDSEVLFFIKRHQLMGRGIGYIDAHLMASLALAEHSRLWTRDKRLIAVSAALNLAYEIS
ncbi:MAG: type II toxin-antitoxin system VapC family toxin [Pseudomonadota bacterium]